MKKYFFISIFIITVVALVIFLPKILPAKTAENLKVENPPQQIIPIQNQLPLSETKQQASQPIVTVVNQRAEVPIFLYHHIRPFEKNLSQAELDLTVWQNIFEEQLNFFNQQGFHSVSLEELYDYFYQGKPLPAKPYVLTFDDGYEDFYKSAWPILQKYQIKATVFIITDFVSQPGYLTWPQIEELAKSELIEFGAHTLDHKYLSLSPPSLTFYRLSQEIFGPKTELEKRTGRCIDFFSYPYGQYNDLILNLVKEVKYLGAVTTKGGVWQEADKIFELKRLRLSNSDSGVNLEYRLKEMFSSKYFVNKR